MIKLTAFILFITCSSFLFASTPEQKGLEIAKQIESKNNGFIGENSMMTMELIDAHGAKTVRKLKGKVKEVNGDGDKSISIFLNPKDVKGTKMLTHTHKSKDDDQWLYLPSFRRVKRISSRNKSGSFMGSEFSFEDLGSQEIEKYIYKWLRDEKFGGEKVWVLERTPKLKSGYSKQIMWVSQKYYNATKIEYYDRKNELLKVANFTKYTKYNVGGKEIWRSSYIDMKNVQTQKKSTFSWDDRKLGVKHTDRDFSKKKLK